MHVYAAFSHCTSSPYSSPGMSNCPTNAISCRRRSPEHGDSHPQQDLRTNAVPSDALRVLNIRVGVTKIILSACRSENSTLPCVNRTNLSNDLIPLHFLRRVLLKRSCSFTSHSTPSQKVQARFVVFETYSLSTSSVSAFVSMASMRYGCHFCMRYSIEAG